MSFSSGSILFKTTAFIISQFSQKKERYLSYFKIMFFKAINIYEGTNCKLLPETQIQIHVAMQIQ